MQNIASAVFESLGIGCKLGLNSQMKKPSMRSFQNSELNYKISHKYIQITNPPPTITICFERDSALFEAAAMFPVPSAPRGRRVFSSPVYHSKARSF